MSRLSDSSLLICSSSVFVVCLAVGFSAQSHAANQAFQDYFTAACTSATGDLARRCGQTEKGQGNISGDSESSLNPNLALSLNDSALMSANERVGDLEKKADESDLKIDMGAFTLLANMRSSEFKADREQDVDRERGSETDTLVFELGLDYRVSERGVVGFLVGYEDTETEFDQNNAGQNFEPQKNAGKIDREAWSVAAFGSYQPTDSIYLHGSVGITNADLDIDRLGTFQESTRTVEQVDSVTAASTDAEDVWASIGAGWSMPIDRFNVSLNSSLTWTKASTDGFTEKDISGSGLAMSFSDVDRDSMVGAVGIGVDTAISSDYGVWVPYASFDYEYEFDFDPDQMTAKYVLDGSSSVYSWTGDKIDEASFMIGAGVQLVLPDGWAAFLDYREQFGNDSYEMRQFTIGIRVEL